MMTRVRTLPLIALVASMMLASLASAAQPITTDSRIKTLVFNPNEVFTITTHYGYQSNIEFGPKEVIDTISVGDRIGWQITPAGRRLFIRAQEENAHTNMTVITNLCATGDYTPQQCWKGWIRPHAESVARGQIVDFLENYQLPYSNDSPVQNYAAKPPVRGMISLDPIP
jgi:hypothetical protein